MTITTTVCDSCNKPIANRMAVSHHGRLYCSRPCGISALGLDKYTELWNAMAEAINARNNRHRLRLLKVAK